MSPSSGTWATGLRATYGRELRAYFFSPWAYVILFFALVLHAFSFTTIVSYLADPRSGGESQTLFQYFFGGWIFSWVIFWVFPPLLTMRLLAEERRSGSIESLMTAPVSETEVVLGKYLAALTFYICLWLPSLFYVLLIGRSNDIDWGPIASALLGTVLIGGMFLAVGVFCSAATRSQIVAGVAAFASVLMLTSLSFVDGLVSSAMWKSILAHTNILDAMSEAGRGIVDTRRIIYPLSVIVFFLFLASRTLAAKKWR